MKTFTEACQTWADQVYEYAESGDPDQGWADLTIYAGNNLAALVTACAQLAQKWDTATELTTGKPSIVAKAFADELYKALRMEGR